MGDLRGVQQRLQDAIEKSTVSWEGSAGCCRRTPTPRIFLERSKRSGRPARGWRTLIRIDRLLAQAPAVTPSTMALKVLLGRMAFDAFAGSGWK